MKIIKFLDDKSTLRYEHMRHCAYVLDDKRVLRKFEKEQNFQND